MLLLSVAIRRDASWLGRDLSGDGAAAGDTVMSHSAGKTVVSTRDIARDIVGYGGSVPLEITIEEGRITGIEALKNSETPEFFARVRERVIPQWIGMTLDEALQADVDGVTGATLSSDAVNATIRRAVSTLSGDAAAAAEESHATPWLSGKGLAALAVALLGAIVPLFLHSVRYRILQLVLNVVVLGFWCGTFVSYSMLINYLSHGVDVWLSLVPMLLLVVAFVYPLLGRRNHYCMWICPMGSLQELAGRCVGYKLRLSPSTLKYLERFRNVLWAVLMLLMWSGVCFSWVDYELFSAFVLGSAAWGVVAAASLFVLLSLVVSRPYCRFVCPTGNLFRISQNQE